MIVDRETNEQWIMLRHKVGNVVFFAQIWAIK